jgi:hypothetical protein
MQNDQYLINELKKMLHWKESKAFYANRLGVSEHAISALLQEIRGKKTLDDLYTYLPSEKRNIETKVKSSAKILLLDIETSVVLAAVFQKQVWKARIGHKQLLSDWYMLTWSAKWLDEEEMFSDALTSEEVIDEDDGRIVTSLWFLLDEADIVIVHNCNFDIPNINTRCVLHKLHPPSPYKQIDTLKIAQQQFGFTHNSLDALANFFGIEGKSDTDFELWKRCIWGDEEALFEMEEYNRNDVIVLEKIYHFLKPYMKGHPNLDLYCDDENPVCTTCGKHTLSWMEGKYFYTQAVRYQIYRCSECGSISRAKKGEPYINKKIMMSIPR